MKQRTEAGRLAHQMRRQCGLLAVTTVPAVRTVRREFSKRLKDTASEIVLELALRLIEDYPRVRFAAYELVCRHGATFEGLSLDDLLKLGKGLNSWDSVDCFGLYLSGPMWAAGRVPGKVIAAWAHSEDLWWRRAALVSTVALSRRGGAGDVRKVERICRMLVDDREDMVVKAMSWAVRELAKKNPGEAAGFVARHQGKLAARVVREVKNKLTTGLKTPRGRNAKGQELPR